MSNDELDALAEEAARRRRYKSLLAFESVFLKLSMVGTAALLAARPPDVCLAAIFGGLLAIAWMWHIVVIPICFMYLIGRPVVIDLSPLIESRALRELRSRPVLSDDAFYARFYEGTGISRDIPIRLRRLLLRCLDWQMDRVIPSDNLALLYDELDFADVLWWVRKELNIRIDKTDYELFDGTFDNLVGFVHLRAGREPA